VESINAAKNTASNFLKTVLSSVTSPAPLDDIIIYLDLDLGGIPASCRVACKSNSEPIYFPQSTPKTTDGDALAHQHQLRVFHGMHNVRYFRLVLCADVSGRMVEHAMETLERIVEGGIDHLPSKPVIVSERRTIRTRYADHNMGWPREWFVVASAL